MLTIKAEARRMCAVTLTRQESAAGELWTGQSAAMRVRVVRVPAAAGPAYWYARALVAAGMRAGQCIAEARGATWQACEAELESAWSAAVRAESEAHVARLASSYAGGA